MAESGARGTAAINHVGICVADLGRSRRFYENVLGFRYWWELTVPDEDASRLLQLPAPLGVHAVYLVHDGFVLELIQFAKPADRSDRPRVMNDLGFTHLSVAVADMPATLLEVASHGGEVLEASNMGGVAVMIKDPDGQLLELTTHRFRTMRPPWPGPEPAR